MSATLVKVILFYNFICLIQATDYPCHKPTCGANQIYSDCENHPCRDTCDSPNLSKVCKYAPGKYPGCICVDGYVKDKDGSCIKRELCDILCKDPNSELVDYPNLCPGGTCDQPIRDDCKVVKPRKGCQCKKDYLLDKNGKCIHKDDCPPKCGLNEEYTGAYCEKTCEVNEGTGGCAAVVSCRCKQGYARHFGKCIKVCDCPTCSKPNERYRYCGSTCPATCDNEEGKKSNGDFCSKSCVAGCFCSPGYVRNAAGDCVKPTQCPPKCGLNEEYTGAYCEKNCENFNEDFSCAAVVSCRCKQGYARHSGTCIKVCDCPKCSKPFEKYRYCGSTCPATCKNEEGKQPCGTSCSKDCVAGCFCVSGYVRSDAGDCIKPTECKSCSYSKRGGLPTPAPKPLPYPVPCGCGLNEHPTNKAPVRQISCDNLWEVPCKGSKPGCVCNVGFVRESSKPGAKCIKRCNCPCLKH